MKNLNQTVVHIDYEEKMSLENAVTFLEGMITKLKEEKSLTLTQGEETFFVKPSQQVELEVKLEERGDKQKLEFELGWIEGEENQGLEIS